MDEANSNLKVKISGKNTLGEPFQEIVTMEQFGNFGVLIHTAQPLKLSDRIFICGAKGEPIASAEVVWVRAGSLPAVEVLLYRSLEPSRTAAAASESATQQPAPIGNEAVSTAAQSSTADTAREIAPPSGKTGSLSGTRPAPPAASLGKTGKTADESTLSDTRSPVSFGTGSLSSAARRTSREKREEAAEAKPTKQSAKEAAINRERLAALQQHRKIAFTAFIVLAILFAAAVAPVGVTPPTPVDILEQKGCSDVASLKRTDEAAVGDLEAWSQSANGAIQFIRREEISAGDAATELENLQKEGLKVRGCWCPKGEGKIVENAGIGELPATFDFIWSFKPVGTNAENLGDLTLEWKDGRLLYKEATTQSVLDRTQDVSKVIYYSGMQKLVVKLNDYTETTVDSPFTRQLIFYLPPGKETASAAEGQLINSTFQIYMAQASPQKGGMKIDIRRILAILLGVALAISIIYLAVNFRRSRA